MGSILATTATTGIVQLAGDFGTQSTATLPRIGSITGNASNATVPFAATRLSWNSGVAPIIDQQVVPVNNTAQVFAISAQAANSASTTLTRLNGGVLRLAGGDSTNPGATGRRGGVQLNIGSAGETIAEAVEVAVNQRFFAMLNLAPIDNATLGTGTGDGVLWIAPVTVAPTSSALVGSLLYVTSGGALTCRGAGGTVTTIAPN